MVFVPSHHLGKMALQVMCKKSTNLSMTDGENIHLKACDI
jgi:hypothetical protein